MDRRRTFGFIVTKKPFKKLRMKLFTPKYTHTFTGYPNPPLNKAKVVILPVPYEGTASYRHGASEGPKAIIDASCNMETYDIETKKDFTALGIHTFDEVNPESASPEKMINSLESIFDKILKLKKFTVMLGGEHSITFGALKSFKKKYKDLTVVQLDAHADLRNKYDGTKFSHACAMRRCREITKVVQVGIRSMSEEEALYLKKNNINTVFYSPEIDTEKILKLVGKNAYLSIDLDVLNPALMPSVGTPEPGGLTWYPFMNFIKQLMRRHNVVAADIVELAPIPGLSAPDFMAAIIAYKIIGYKFF